MVGYTGEVTIGYHAVPVAPDPRLPPFDPGAAPTPPLWRFTIGEGAKTTATDAAVFPLDGTITAYRLGDMPGGLPPQGAPDERKQVIDHLVVHVDGAQLSLVGQVAATGHRRDTTGVTIATGQPAEPFSTAASNRSTVTVASLTAMTSGTLMGTPDRFASVHSLIGPVMTLEATADRDCGNPSRPPVRPAEIPAATSTAGSSPAAVFGGTAAVVGIIGFCALLAGVVLSLPGTPHR
ncbi:hypothetical protein JZY06_00615 [Corynebacterium sp. CCM 8862]|uniref:Uncharacterized protein n=1 Tax=Corynebacterium mendelii TaxID=2765362 RepID=A0A939DYH3_9CORY|nr:hypothetical protein [Corynebacterium mendelii]